MNKETFFGTFPRTLATVAGVFTAVGIISGGVAKATGVDLGKLVPLFPSHIEDMVTAVAANTSDRLQREIRMYRQDVRDIEADIEKQRQRKEPVPPRWERDIERYQNEIDRKRKELDKIEQRR